jgi:hypothetical protein
MSTSRLASGQFRGVSAAVVLGALVIIGFPIYLTGAKSLEHRHHLIGGAVWTAAVLIAIGMWAIENSAGERRGTNNYGYFDPIIGVDGRVSTSKTIMLVWTFELAAALIFLGAIVGWNGDGSSRTVGMVFGTGDWNGYLLLLGGPFAAAVIAKGITSSQTGADSSAKTPTADAAPSVTTTSTTGAHATAKDVLQDDDGSISLPDTQYTIFSLVAMLYFFVALIGNVVNYAAHTSVNHIGLPAIPSALLGLTSLGALTYIGNKAVTSAQGVRVATLTPNSAAVTAEVTAKVANLPADATAASVRVVTSKTGSLAAPQAPTAVSAVEQSVTFAAPAAAGEWTVVIFTSNYSSPAMTLTVTA